MMKDVLRNLSLSLSLALSSLLFFNLWMNKRMQSIKVKNFLFSPFPFSSQTPNREKREPKNLDSCFITLDPKKRKRHPLIYPNQNKIKRKTQNSVFLCLNYCHFLPFYRKPNRELNQENQTEHSKQETNQVIRTTSGNHLRGLVLGAHFFPLLPISATLLRHRRFLSRPVTNRGALADPTQVRTQATHPLSQPPATRLHTERPNLRQAVRGRVSRRKRERESVSVSVSVSMRQLKQGCDPLTNFLWILILRKRESLR
jgi:hypothetical protein